MDVKVHRYLLVITLVSFCGFSLQARISKQQTEQTTDHWQTYGDTWSEWAKNWEVGWSDDDKHTLEDTTADAKNAVPDAEVENENVTLFGTKTMSGKQIKKNLTMYGAGTLTEVVVGGVLTDYGRLNAKKSTFNQVDAYGKTMLDNCTVMQNAHIYGLLTAVNCNFQASILAWSPTVTLTKSKVLGDLIIKPDMGSKKQVVELHDTVIHGSVIFEKKGSVILTGTAAIKGTVVQGHVKKRPSQKQKS